MKQNHAVTIASAPRSATFGSMSAEEESDTGSLSAILEE
jgi:hypothetical protein